MPPTFIRNKKRMLLRLAAAVVIPILAELSMAQTPDDRALYSARSLKCQFPVYASTKWEKDEPTPQVKKQEFGFHIDGIDLQQGKARIIGNFGATDLIVKRGVHVVHFIEITPLGNMNITSVFAATSKTHRFKAVHSRHLYMSGGPLPSQNYGYCQRWE